MSVLPELEKRLAENEERIAALIQHLEDQAELEESLRAAGSGLNKANSEVKRVAESTKVATESLVAILASFREAVEILRQADPARATEAVGKIEERLNSAEQSIRKAIPTTIAYITLVLVLILVGIEILRYFFPSLLSG